MKKCTGCRKDKLKSEFYKDKKAQDKLTTKCKTCIKKIQARRLNKSANILSIRIVRYLQEVKEDMKYSNNKLKYLMDKNDKLINLLEDEYKII